MANQSNEDWFEQIPAVIAKSLIANSVTCAAAAAALLRPLRGGDPRVEEWFESRATRAALLSFDKLSRDEQDVLLAGPPNATSEDVSERPASAQTLAEFAIEEGFDLVAVVGLKVESGMAPLDAGLQGAIVKLDGASIAANGAPPVSLELVHALRAMANDLERKAKEAGEHISRRIPFKRDDKGGN